MGFDMSESINQYRHMWTDQNSDYWLVEVNNDYAIFKISRFGFVTIEDDDISKVVIRKLLEANTKIISMKEFNAYLQTIVVDGSIVDWDES